MLNTRRPTKGEFAVKVQGKVVASTGPEPRPFEALRALNMEVQAVHNPLF
jgi:hypothetical protein